MIATIQRIIVATEHADMTIDAVVAGQWAAHRKLGPFVEAWTVSHVPTGMHIHGIVGDCSPARAVAIACALSERVPTLGERPSVEEREQIEAAVGSVGL